MMRRRFQFIRAYFYRVTSHVKAMEDAVEIGLRSAFNDVKFTSFSKVLPGLKLKGEHLSISHRTRLIAYLAHTQPENRPYRITLPMNSAISSKPLLNGIPRTITRI